MLSDVVNDLSLYFKIWIIRKNSEYRLIAHNLALKKKEQDM